MRVEEREHLITGLLACVVALTCARPASAAGTIGGKVREKTHKALPASGSSSQGSSQNYGGTLLGMVQGAGDLARAELQNKPLRDLVGTGEATGDGQSIRRE